MTATSVPAGAAQLTAEQVEALRLQLQAWVPADPPERLTASLLSGGRSNLTYVLSDGRREWILRRPPLGHVLETAHDMRREFRVMTALAPTPVPVPATVGLQDDDALLGAGFYVMERVPGAVLRTADDLQAVPADAVSPLADAFIDSLADLHAVDPSAVGLDDFGRPAGYLERQVRRWGRQLAASRSRDVPGFDELSAALGREIPTTSHVAVVHGDHRLDNAVVDLKGAPRISALLDWEMSTLGDPLADLALSWLYWEGWQGLDNPIAATPAEHPGWPRFDALTARYATRSGLTPVRTAWYRAFAIYKFAVICEGIHFRYVRGLTASEGFDSIGAMVPPLVQRGRELLADTEGGD